MLTWGSATVLNLSLLTSDVWAALARVLFFGGFSAQSGALFTLAFLLVAAGLVTYTLSGTVRSQTHPSVAARAPVPEDAEDRNQDLAPLLGGKSLEDGGGCMCHLISNRLGVRNVPPFRRLLRHSALPAYPGGVNAEK